MRFLPLADTNPKESWWTDYPHFYERARAELPRMRVSMYGFILVPSYSYQAPIQAAPVAPVAPVPAESDDN